MSRLDKMFRVVRPIVDAITTRGGTAFLVGGAVRDMVMGGDPHDFDVEVFGLPMVDLVILLMEFGAVKETGARFQVVKLNRQGHEFDFSLPRRDMGAGRNSFETEADPFMSTRDAAARRDFTINALMMNLSTVEIVDHFNGLDDIMRGFLRPVSDAFADDPLRVVRMVQFAARFNFTPATDDDSMRRFKACFTGDAGDRLRQLLGTDPMRAEALKWFNAPFPGAGLRAMHSVGFTSFFPELATLANTPQDPRWHPEGDVLTHTSFVMDAAATICDNRIAIGENVNRVKIVAAALCHDLGKPETTVIHDDGAITSAGHAVAGVKHTVHLLCALGFGVQSAVLQDACKLVREHMIASGVSDDTNMPRFVRRLSTRVNITELHILVTADCSGRPANKKEIGKIVGNDEMERIAAMARHVNIAEKPPQGLIRGQDLIDMGLKHGVNGVHFGAIIEKCFEAQIEGVFNDRVGAIEFMKQAVKEMVRNER